VYIEIRKGISSLQQASLLAYHQLQKRLAPHGYFPTYHTPGMWTHKTRSVAFLLIVDDFAVKYVGEENAHRLRNTTVHEYEMTTN
jgi:hypothetical protein